MLTAKFKKAGAHTAKRGQNTAQPQIQTESERLDFAKKSYVLMAKFIDTVNKSQLLEYIELVNSPKKLFYRNFLAGIGKGLGLTVGTAIVLGVLFKICQHMLALNIPYINEWLLEIANLIKSGGK